MNNWTPLHFAAMRGHAGVVEILLGRGASIEAVNKSNVTPLQIAAQNHHTNVVKLLEDKATKVNGGGNSAWALMASYFNKAEVIHMYCPRLGHCEEIKRGWGTWEWGMQIA